MSDDDLNQRLSQFRSQKEKYELEKTSLLQDDEIGRLKKELKIITLHCDKAKDHSNETVKMFKKQKRTIINEIKSVPTSLSIIKAKMISHHTKAINSLKNTHYKNLKLLKTQYKETMKIIIQNNEVIHGYAKDDDDDDEKYDDSFRFGTNYYLFSQANAEETALLHQLEATNILIDNERRRAKKLQKQIDKIKKEMMNDRIKENKAYKANIQESKTIQNMISENKSRDVDIDAQKIELLSKEEAQKYHVKMTNLINGLRDKIDQIRTKTQMLKINIETNQTPSALDLDASVKELAGLQQEYRDILEKQRRIDKDSYIKEKKKHKTKTKKTVQQIKFLIQDLDDARAENAVLLDELKRLDYMIYGKGGQFQKVKRDRPKIVHFIC